MRLRRRSLPLFWPLEIRFDIAELQKDFLKLGLNEYERYNDLNAGSEFYSNALAYRKYLRKWFMNDSEVIQSESNGEGLSGSQYRQLALTKFDTSKKSDQFSTGLEPLRATSGKQLMQRVDPRSALYVPEADERNYTVRTEVAVDSFGKLLDSFQAKVTRSRFAVLMPGFRTATHIDSDTNYTVRIHIPIITNPDAVFGIYRGKQLTELHLPADGRAWFVNAGYPHYVENRGTEPRVHIIVALDGQEDLATEEFRRANGVWGEGTGEP
jgi:hypothetical protein